MNTSTFEQKLSIILGDRKYSPTERLNFTAHETNFRPTLDQILEKANQKIAVLHSKINVSTEPFDEKNMLSSWEEERIPIAYNPFFSNPPVVRINHESAYTRFNQMREKFSAQPDLSKIRLEIQENSNAIHESLLISKNH
jgi:nicotinamide mononucleotide adenylyltransferase